MKSPFFYFYFSFLFLTFSFFPNVFFLFDLFSSGPMVSFINGLRSYGAMPRTFQIASRIIGLCLCFVHLAYSATGWSAVCDCYIS